MRRKSCFQFCFYCCLFRIIAVITSNKAEIMNKEYNKELFEEIVEKEAQAYDKVCTEDSYEPAPYTAFIKGANFVIDYLSKNGI